MSSAIARLKVGAWTTSERKTKRHEQCESVNHALSLASLPARYKQNPALSERWRTWGEQLREISRCVLTSVLTRPFFLLVFMRFYL